VSAAENAEGDIDQRVRRQSGCRQDAEDGSGKGCGWKHGVSSWRRSLTDRFTFYDRLLHNFVFATIPERRNRSGADNSGEF
jgi:hypothetical protein